MDYVLTEKNASSMFFCLLNKLKSKIISGTIYKEFIVHFTL